MASIGSSVGWRAANQQGDVRVGQSLLNRFTRRTGGGSLAVDGLAGERTVAAIRRLQQQVAGLDSPDGRVDPGGPTWRRLDGKPPSPARLSGGLVAAGRVPAQADCSIVWDHGQEEASRKGAQQMLDLFGLVYQPALDSRHIAGRAVDMEICWSGSAQVYDARGLAVALGAPNDRTNRAPHEVGASYGVIKNADDQPHWSDDGR